MQRTGTQLGWGWGCCGDYQRGGLGHCRQLTIVLELSKAKGWLQSPYCQNGIRQKAGEEKPKRRWILSSLFRCHGFMKLAKLFMGRITPVHYIIVFWGLKNQKNGGEEKQVVTNVTPVPPGPSHLEDVPVCEKPTKIGLPRKKTHCL